jgi:hypothetical protein
MQRKPKSTSDKRRDLIRIMKFNLSKKEEELSRKRLKIDSMSKHIFKLELEISKVKFSSYKSKPKLAICHVANQNIPPAAHLPSSPKPPISKLTCVTLKSTCDTPECRNRHRPCFYNGMPKPWYDDL